MFECRESRNTGNALSTDRRMDGVAKFGFLKVVEGHRAGFLRLALHESASVFENVEFHECSGVKIDLGHRNKSSAAVLIDSVGNRRVAAMNRAGGTGTRHPIRLGKRNLSRRRLDQSHRQPVRGPTKSLTCRKELANFLGAVDEVSRSDGSHV